jgi:hypothetical protein
MFLQCHLINILTNREYIMPGGRPKKEIDYDTVEKLASIMATQEEIATFLDMSVKTLQRDEEFCRIYKKGLEKGRMSIRRQQYKSAEGGNVTMQIWLGKQYLNQRDRNEYIESVSSEKLESLIEQLEQDDSNNEA